MSLVKFGATHGSIIVEISVSHLLLQTNDEDSVDRQLEIETSLNFKLSIKRIFIIAGSITYVAGCT